MVVLPVPFTPTTRITPGTPSAPRIDNDRSASVPTSRSNSVRSARRAASGSATPSMDSSRRRAATSSSVGPTPRSALMRVASRSSHASASMRSAANTDSRPRAKGLLLADSRRRSRAKRVAAGSGTSVTASGSPPVVSSAGGWASVACSMSEPGASASAGSSAAGSAGGNSGLRPTRMVTVATRMASTIPPRTNQKISTRGV